MADELDAMLDAFERPGEVQHSTVPQRAVPLEHVPDPEPAEPWHNEPAVDGPKVYPVTITRVEPAPAPEIVYRPDPPTTPRKTPDEMNWRECWLRIGKLYARGHMDAAQYADLIAKSASWKDSGYPNPPVDLLESVRMALWAFESVDEERDRERARRSPRDRRNNQGTGSVDQRLHEHDAAG